jgi:hypothetical protein
MVSVTAAVARAYANAIRKMAANPELGAASAPGWIAYFNIGGVALNQSRGPIGAAILAAGQKCNGPGRLNARGRRLTVR